VPGKDLSEKAQAFVDKGAKDAQWAFGCIVAFLMHHKARYDAKQITAGTLRNYYKPLRVFCEANDIDIKWQKITRGLPKPRKFAQDRAPTDDEIRRILRYGDRKLTLVVLIMSSSGIRVGAWDFLRWGHIEPVIRDGKVVAARMKVYGGEAEEYVTFITPEAYACAREWMALREEYGEKITPNSWLLRDNFKTATQTYGAHSGLACTPRRLKSSGVRSMLKRAWVAQGLMKDATGKLYEFKSSHGFRKRWKTICELAGLKPLNIEMMLGHDSGISGSYYRPNDADLCNDYVRAVDDLTLDEGNRLKSKVAELSAKVADDTDVKRELAEKDKQIERLQEKQAQFEALLQRLIDEEVLKPAS
jgi:integrase